jgi:hypothetical protein
LAGKGFAVVAGEVKHLVATIATGEIAATIATVERDSAWPAMAASTGGIGQAATEAAGHQSPARHRGAVGLQVPSERHRAASIRTDTASYPAPAGPGEGGLRCTTDPGSWRRSVQPWRWT